ncbi:MAG: hypothetical protein II969_06185 [Anaerolineaceae bacterium]|nr:hypothetical protein [Anaerolineaceae bacterium]
MSQTNGAALIKETEKYLNDTKTAQTDAESAALPFETLDEYIDDPTGFNDVTAKLWLKVNTVFDLAVKYNRHSSDYLKSLSLLEKGIKYLGSSCLQKYALELKKYVFPELAQLNTENLYKMTAIHFNKIDRALTEYINEHQTVDDALLDMEYRYYNLMERLRATEVKLYNYRDNYYLGSGNSNPIIHGLAFSDKSWGKSIHEHDKPMAFQRARAFSAKSENGGQCSVAGDQCSVVRDQQSVASQQSVNGGQLAVTSGNEEGRMKKEENSGSGCQVSDDRNQDAAATSSNPENREMVREQLSKNPEAHVVCLDDAAKSAQQDCTQAAEPPLCIQIMNQVVMRSRIQGLDYLGFTEREMRLLASDPLFESLEPLMASDIRKALAEFDNSE